VGLLDRDGLFVLGTVDSVEEVKYGQDHERSGQVVRGLWRANIDQGLPWMVGVTFNQIDMAWGEPTQPFRVLVDERDGTVVGQRVVIRVTGRSSGGKFVNYDAVLVAARAVPVQHTQLLRVAVASGRVRDMSHVRWCEASDCLHL